jgi:hypothetical protein
LPYAKQPERGNATDAPQARQSLLDIVHVSARRALEGVQLIPGGDDHDTFSSAQAGQGLSWGGVFQRSWNPRCETDRLKYLARGSVQY